MEHYLHKTERELKIRNYSRLTMKAYLGALRFYFLFNERPDRFCEDSVKNFLMKKQAEGCASKTLHVYLSAIKFFYRDVLKTSHKINIKFARKNRRLPITLDKKEIQQIITKTTNRKHRIIIALAYGAGLRVSEVTNLQVQNLDFGKALIRIENSKGAKDRYTLLPETLISELKEFTHGKSRGDPVFESMRGGKLTTRTLQKIFLAACARAEILKPATFHSLRHSFATHLVQSGVNINIVQELLGHTDLKTTQIYVHIAKTTILSEIRSPLATTSPHSLPSTGCQIYQ